MAPVSSRPHPRGASGASPHGCDGFTVFPHHHLWKEWPNHAGDDRPGWSSLTAISAVPAGVNALRPDGSVHWLPRARMVSRKTHHTDPNPPGSTFWIPDNTAILDIQQYYNAPSGYWWKNKGAGSWKRNKETLSELGTPLRGRVVDTP